MSQQSGNTVPRMFELATSEGGDRTAWIHRDGKGGWNHVSFRTVRERAEALGAGFVALGVKPGDRIAILSNSRPEWSLVDYALLGAGVTNVPIYQTNSAAEVAFILDDAEATGIVVEDAAQLAKVLEVRDQLPLLEHVVVIDDTGLDAGEGVPLTIAALEADGANNGSARASWRTAGEAVQPTDFATIIYTSGTTGPPKGCVLDHANLADTADMLHGLGDVFHDDDRIVLFLPLAHILARCVAYVAMRTKIELAYTAIPTLMDDLGELQPTLLPSVPRVFEKAHARIAATFDEATGAKGRLIKWSMRKGALRGRYVQAGRRVPPVLAAQYAVATKLVFSKIHERFGGRMRYCISGGAPLSREVQEFFLAAGMVILEGYGLTEATPTNLNLPHDFRLGTVGKVLPQCDVKLADDGEILLHGPMVFREYYKHPEATAEALTDDRWLRTGDIGTIDRDGFLYITDRKKDIIITAGGKNVAPQNIENVLKSTPLISQAVVIGDKLPYLTALLTLDAEELASWAKDHGQAGKSHAELVALPEIESIVDAAVKKANGEVGRVEQVKKWRLLPVDFTIETGELTPTLKLKRKLVSQRYGTWIDAMYEAGAADAEVITDDAVAEAQRTPVPA